MRLVSAHFILLYILFYLYAFAIHRGSFFANLNCWNEFYKFLRDLKHPWKILLETMHFHSHFSLSNLFAEWLKRLNFLTLEKKKLWKNLELVLMYLNELSNVYNKKKMCVQEMNTKIINNDWSIQSTGFLQTLKEISFQDQSSASELNLHKNVKGKTMTIITNSACKNCFNLLYRSLVCLKNWLYL